MPRRDFPAKVKVAAYERSGGHCEKCTAPLYTGKFQYDHVIPDAMGGEPTLENCEVLCSNCHGAKTAGEDVPRIAKTKRTRAKHLGAKARRGRPMAGTVASGWKQTINNGWERR